MENDKKIPLSSSESLQTSLTAVRLGHTGLDKHRKKLLEKVPESGDWAKFPRGAISFKDIAYLSAAEHHEFALLRGKHEDILFHGVALHCYLDEELIRLLKEHKLELIAHTHPDWGTITPSQNDRNFLRSIGQKKSSIISSITGKELIFSSSLFEDF